jgi:hypothetical protein
MEIKLERKGRQVDYSEDIILGGFLFNTGTKMMKMGY